MIGLALVGIAAVAGCGSSSDGDDDSTTSASEAPAQEAPEPVTEGEPAETEEPKEKKEKPDGTPIKLGDSQFGDVLFGAENDQAIYLFDVDEENKSNCSGDCAAAWPPVLTKGEPLAKGGVDQKLLDTTKRDDGSRQVTYNGHPLYYYVNEGPNEVRCSNVFLNGGNWYAVTPSGDRV